MASDDDRLAHELAAAAGSRLLALRATHTNPDAAHPGGSDAADDLRKAGDRLSHEFLVAELARRRPADRVLSEEGADDRARLSADRVWIVDPLDGTREFGEPGRSDWAVHVALWERGTLTAGAVALPAQGQVLSTADPPPPPPDRHALRRPVVVVSRTRPAAFRDAMAATLDADLVPLGSAGAKAAAVLRGEADAYVHAGGQHEWDSAAPVAVAAAAGWHASRIDGAPLVYNQPDPLIPDILISRPALVDALLHAIRSSRTTGGLSARTR